MRHQSDVDTRDRRARLVSHESADCACWLRYVERSRDDWARTQPETDSRIELFRKYPPLLFADEHENGTSSYFFPPNTDPIYHEVPDTSVDWMDNVYGPAMAKAFTDLGYRYFVEFVEENTATAPRELPRVEVAPEARLAIKEKVEDFEKPAAAEPDQNLVLTADEINALIDENPDLKGQIYVTIQGDRVKGKLSLSLEPLSRIVERLRKETSAVLVFATTTPIHDQRHARRNAEFDRTEADVRRYNEVAVRVMRDLKVPVDDLHFVVESDGAEKLMTADGTHYTPAGSRRLAEAVADCVKRQLALAAAMIALSRKFR